MRHFVVIVSLLAPVLANAAWPMHLKSAELDKCVQSVTSQMPQTPAGERHAHRFCTCIVNHMERDNPRPTPATFKIRYRSHVTECSDK